MRREREKKNQSIFFFPFPFLCLWRWRWGRISRRTKNILSYRWEDETVKVCQQKEFQKCITKKRVFTKSIQLKRLSNCLRASQRYCFTLWIQQEYLLLKQMEFLLKQEESLPGEWLWPFNNEGKWLRSLWLPDCRLMINFHIRPPLAEHCYSNLWSILAFRNMITGFQKHSHNK